MYSYRNNSPYANKPIKRMNGYGIKYHPQATGEISSLDRDKHELDMEGGFLDGVVDKLSRGIINPAVKKVHHDLTKQRFGKHYADNMTKGIERQLEKNPTLVFDLMTDPDFWKDSFKKTHEFLKNDKIMKDLKEPIGDALSAIPAVGTELKDGWKDLTRKDGPETDLKGSLDKMEKKYKNMEKKFKKYKIPPPPLLFAFANSEEYLKGINAYKKKYKKQLIQMRDDEQKKKGNGTRRAGDGLSRAGEGLHGGMPVEKNEVGKELREEMIKKHCP